MSDEFEEKPRIYKQADVVCTLDLEMNQPSGKIIEVGYTIGNIHTGEVLLNKGLIVNPGEPLSEFIINLTHITEEMAQTGISLEDAYKECVADCERLDARKQPVEWGGGDIRTLRQQAWEKDNNILVNNWSFGYTTMNIKCIVQGILGAHKKSTQGGLAKSLIKFGLKFKGTKHRAVDDSLNTFLLYVELLKRLQVVEVKK
jgi:inhibitor of KinA sporulation pathway (predicted exonuclease)